MKVPEKGWALLKKAEESTNRSEIFLDGKLVPNVQKVEVVVDAEKSFPVLRLEIASPQLFIDFVHENNLNSWWELVKKDVVVEPFTSREIKDLDKVAEEGAQIMEGARKAEE